MTPKGKPAPQPKAENTDDIRDGEDADDVEDACEPCYQNGDAKNECWDSRDV